MADDNTRERVRALVRDVLQNALPAQENGEETGDGQEIYPVRPGEQATVSAAIPPSPALTAKPEKPEEKVARDESSKTIITESDVQGLEEGARLRVAEGVRLTPLAADIVRERRIELVRRTSRRGKGRKMLVAIGSDHGGYQMKEDIKNFLTELGHRVRDFGTDSTDPVDYPDFAHAVARAVARAEADVGIIIDGAGVGSAITANKVPGVRAAACYSPAIARNSREHNDANVLTLGSKAITSAEMREIVAAWLSTEISEDRHIKRVSKITAVERQYAR